MTVEPAEAAQVAPAPPVARGIEPWALAGTALTLLLRPGGPWWVRTGLILLAAAALLSPRVAARSALWWGLAAVAGARLVADWPLPDNHLYLEAYWCLALALAFGGRDPAAIARRGARLLVGGAFLFAVLWKAFLSPDYLDGRFFRVTLLTDPRMEHAVLSIGGLDAAAIEANRDALAPWPAGSEPLDPARPVEPPALRALGGALTWGGLALEGAVAVAFLAPLQGAARKLRPLLLLTFCALTYALAPVAGFAWILLAMSLAALPPGASPTWRRAHLAVAAIVLVSTELPWARLLDAS